MIEDFFLAIIELYLTRNIMNWQTMSNCTWLWQYNLKQIISNGKYLGLARFCFLLRDFKIYHMVFTRKIYDVVIVIIKKLVGYK